MDVSIIIVNYNTWELTRAAIRSIYQETKDCTYEIILVDNASDKDPGILLNDFPDIKLIRSPENIGFAKGNNLGIAEANGDYILLLNSDTELKNDAISSVHRFLSGHPDVAVASARLEFPDGRIQHVCQRFPSAKYLAIELFRIQKLWSEEHRSRILLGAFFDHCSFTYTDWVWGTFFMFRKNLLNELPENKLDDRFFMYGEDVLWCKQFGDLGYKVAYLPEARVVHFMGASKGPKNELMIRHEKEFLRLYYSRLSRLLIAVLSTLLNLSNRKFKSA